jgi:hypothetical protein
MSEQGTRIREMKNLWFLKYKEIKTENATFAEVILKAAITDYDDKAQEVLTFMVFKQDALTFFTDLKVGTMIDIAYTISPSKKDEKTGDFRPMTHLLFSAAPCEKQLPNTIPKDAKQLSNFRRLKGNLWKVNVKELSSGKMWIATVKDSVYYKSDSSYHDEFIKLKIFKKEIKEDFEKLNSKERLDVSYQILPASYNAETKVRHEMSYVMDKVRNQLPLKKGNDEKI